MGNQSVYVCSVWLYLLCGVQLNKVELETSGHKIADVSSRSGNIYIIHWISNTWRFYVRLKIYFDAAWKQSYSFKLRHFDKQQKLH